MPNSLPNVDILAKPVTPDAAIAFWGWKSALPYNEAKKLAEGARERAFYVTGLAERDAVQSVKDALGEALKNGETLQGFKVRCLDTIKKQGWHDRRIEIIFRNNMQTAYAAGRYSKMQQVKESRPYWQYLTIGDKRVRPSDAVLHGLVYPADHEFWDTNYPPNGHKCRCGSTTLSSRQVKSRDLIVQKNMPSAMLYTDPKTGMEYHIARPGAADGWRNNPGKMWTSGLDLKKYEDLTPASYVEQRIRPQKVKNFEELADGIRLHAGKYARNSSGFKRIREVDEPYFMATDTKGLLKVSVRERITSKGRYNPSASLQSAWNKIADDKSLDWLEEYSVEALWHEILHNRQTFISGMSDKQKRIMEIVTQWTARRTYPDFLQSLGGKAWHLESIKKEGMGYKTWITNFDKLLDKIGISEDTLLPFMHTLIDTHPTSVYGEKLIGFLVETTGRNRETLIKALNKIDWLDDVLKVLRKN